MPGAPEASGSHVFTLEPGEIDAVAARYGLRSALAGGLTARHHAPLAAFALTLLFAAILARTGLISRRAGEMTFLIAALAFMIQRLLTHRRIWRARNRGRAEVERLLSGRQMTLMIRDSVIDEIGGATPRQLLFADCREAEETGGLVYLWGGDGPPFVLPRRILAEGDAARIVTRVRNRISRRRRPARRSA